MLSNCDNWIWAINTYLEEMALIVDHSNHRLLSQTSIILFSVDHYLCGLVQIALNLIFNCNTWLGFHLLMVRCTHLRSIRIYFHIWYACVAIYTSSKHNQCSKFNHCKLVKLVKVESLSIFPFVCLWFSETFLKFSVSVWKSVWWCCTVRLYCSWFPLSPDNERLLCFC